MPVSVLIGRMASGSLAMAPTASTSKTARAAAAGRAPPATGVRRCRSADADGKEPRSVSVAILRRRASGESRQHLVDEQTQVAGIRETCKDHLEKVESEVHKLLEVLDECGGLAGKGWVLVLEFGAGPTLSFGTRG